MILTQMVFESSSFKFFGIFSFIAGSSIGGGGGGRVLDLSLGRGCRPDLETRALFMTKKIVKILKN